MVYADRRGLFLNGKAEAASGAPTCEKRVNTFSFCGTGGSPFVKYGRSIAPPVIIYRKSVSSHARRPIRFFYSKKSAQEILCAFW